MSVPQAAVRTLTLTLPLPPRELLPNRVNRTHWAPSARLAREYKAECIKALWAQMRCEWHPLPFERARLSLRFECCTGRKRPDADNFQAAFKHGQDALVGLILRSDSPLYLDIGRVEVTRHKRGCHCAGRVVIEITERTDA